MAQEVENKIRKDVIHEDIVEKVEGESENQATISDMAELYKAMSDPTRLKIINNLMISEMCVYDLAYILDISQPAVSHHLKILRDKKLVKYRKSGKNVFYSLDDHHVKDLFRIGLEHIKE